MLVTYSWEPALLDHARNIAFDLGPCRPEGGGAELICRQPGAPMPAAPASRCPTSSAPCSRNATSMAGRRSCCGAFSPPPRGKISPPGAAGRAMAESATGHALTLLSAVTTAPNTSPFQLRARGWAGEPIADAIPGCHKEFVDARGSGFPSPTWRRTVPALALARPSINSHRRWLRACPRRWPIMT